MNKENIRKVRWGDIYYCDLGKMKGSVQCGRRPVIVIQTNRLNSSSPTPKFTINPEDIMIEFSAPEELVVHRPSRVTERIAYQAVNTALVQRNWLLGYRIAEEEMQGEIRSEYGLEVIKEISKKLTKLYGKRI